MVAVVMSLFAMRTGYAHIMSVGRRFHRESTHVRLAVSRLVEWYRGINRTDRIGFRAGGAGRMGERSQAGGFAMSDGKNDKKAV